MGRIGPEALAANLVKLSWRALAALGNGVIDALAKTGGLTAKSTGMIAATELEPTAPDDGCGPVTRRRQMTDQRGQGHESAVTVSGWTRLVWIDAHPQLPVAAPVVPSHAHEPLSVRALVPQARTNLAGQARLHTGVCDRGCWDGVDVGWLAPPGIVLVVPAQETRAVTVDARAQAAAGAGVTVGRRAHPVRQGHGSTAGSERLATEGVGLSGLTPDDQEGTPEHGRQHHRRDFPPHPIHAVVVRTWHTRA